MRKFDEFCFIFWPSADPSRGHKFINETLPALLRVSIILRIPSHARRVSCSRGTVWVRQLCCAMPPQKRSFAELGFVAEVCGGYRADFNIREGQNIRHIRGPRRGNKQRALGDLETIRAAAAVFPMLPMLLACPRPPNPRKVSLKRLGRFKTLVRCR